jgi:hypothetical protein
MIQIAGAGVTLRHCRGWPQRADNADNKTMRTIIRCNDNNGSGAFALSSDGPTLRLCAICGVCSEFFAEFVGVHRVFESLFTEFMSGQVIPLAMGFGGGAMAMRREVARSTSSAAPRGLESNHSAAPFTPATVRPQRKPCFWQRPRLGGFPPCGP